MTMVQDLFRGCCDLVCGVHVAPLASALAGVCGFDLGGPPPQPLHIVAALFVLAEVVHSFLHRAR